MYVWRRVAACGCSRGGAGWAGMAAAKAAADHVAYAHIYCLPMCTAHSLLNLFDLGECNTVSGAGVEGEAVVIDQHGDHDV